MNILGINGSVGWDGNISSIGEQDYWVHGSGATLFIFFIIFSTSSFTK